MSILPGWPRGIPMPRSPRISAVGCPHFQLEPPARIAAKASWICANAEVIIIGTSGRDADKFWGIGIYGIQLLRGIRRLISANPMSGSRSARISPSTASLASGVSLWPPQKACSLRNNHSHRDYPSTKLALSSSFYTSRFHFSLQTSPASTFGKESLAL